MAFVFSPEQRERLFDALGRSDSGAWHLTEDVELALEAYAGSALAPDASVDIQASAAEFRQIREHVARLRAELYALPEHARKLAAFEVLSGDSTADLIRLGNVAGDALERLGSRLAAIVPAQAPPAGPCALAERFVHAVGQAFRNRLNIKPTVDAHGSFRRFLDTLVDIVRRRHADLDELSRVMTDERLKGILAID
jgi:PAS domain-containing protein